MLYAQTKIGLFFGDLGSLLENYVSKYDSPTIIKRRNPLLSGETYATMIRNKNGNVGIGISHYDFVFNESNHNVQASVFSKNENLVKVILKELEEIKELNLSPAPKELQETVNRGTELMVKSFLIYKKI